jgi:flagellar motility protein MotE (MotC chaperone)
MCAQQAEAKTNRREIIKISVKINEIDTKKKKKYKESTEPKAGSLER